MNTPINTPTQILYTVDFKLHNTTQHNAAIRRNINRTTGFASLSV